MNDARQTPEDPVIKHVREQTTPNRQRTLMRSSSMLPCAKARRLSQACGNAGSTPAANRAGKSHSPAS